MTDQIGLWIDHRQALVVEFGKGEARMSRFQSGAKHNAFRGAPKARGSYSPQYGEGDDQLDNQFRTQLHAFYGRVLGAVRAASHVLIAGPGIAKTEFRKQLERSKQPGRAVCTATTGRLTDRQFVAMARKHFEEEDLET